MKKLWETKIFSSKDGNSRKEKALALFATHFLTILLSIFLFIVVVVLALVLWTSYGGGNKKEASKAFYDPSKSTVATSSSTNETGNSSTTTTTSSSSSQPKGDTLVVQAGEGAGQIAARAGISIDQLYALNPDKMVGPGGTWWANPGDLVYIN